MKRADIQPWQVYGYSTSRTHIYRYTPVMVLSAASYFRSRFGERQVGPCQDADEKLAQAKSYSSGVGLLAVMLPADRTDHDSIRRLRALATVDKALIALNESGAGVREIRDTDDPKAVLGTYMLMTDTRHLHGDYHTLVRELDEAEQRSRDESQRQEESRLADLARYDGIVGRFADLGIMLARAGQYDHPSMVKMTFEQAERLLGMVEVTRVTRA